MDAIDTFNDYNFVDQITMICPLADDEKQLLLDDVSNEIKIFYANINIILKHQYSMEILIFYLNSPPAALTISLPPS